MTQVSTNASGKPDHDTAFELGGTTIPSLPPVRLLVAAMLAAAVLALGLALRAPLATTVLGLIAFGVLHNVLEIRYVAGRFAAILTGRFLSLLLVLTTGIAVCRLTAVVWPHGSRVAEVAVGYVILAAGCWIGLRRGWLALGLGVLGLAAWASFAWPAYHFVVLTQVGKGRITILDPARGERVLTTAEVSEHFTGVAPGCGPTSPPPPLVSLPSGVSETSSACAPIGGPCGPASDCCASNAGAHG